MNNHDNVCICSPVTKLVMCHWITLLPEFHFLIEFVYSYFNIQNLIIWDYVIISMKIINIDVCECIVMVNKIVISVNYHEIST